MTRVAPGQPVHPANSRYGFALLLSLIVITAMGVLIVALTTAVGNPVAAPHATRASSITELAAADAIGDVLDEWNPAWRRMATGQTDTRTYTSGAVTTSIQIVRTGQMDYQLQVSAAGPNTSVIRTIAVTRRYLSFPWQAVISSVGTVSLENGQTLDGYDIAPPTGTDCGALQPDIPGLYLNNRAQLVTDSVTYQSGSPSLAVVDPTLSGSALNTLGMATVPEIVDARDWSLAAGAFASPTSSFSAGICSGWGNPYSVDGCEAYYPIVYASNGLTLQGGYGQGILVVDGGLILTGNAQWWGVVIVNTGSLMLNGTGNPGIYGKVIMRDPAGTFTLRRGTVGYSSCAVARTNYGRGISRPIPSMSVQDILSSRNVR